MVDPVVAARGSLRIRKRELLHEGAKASVSTSMRRIVTPVATLVLTALTVTSAAPQPIPSSTRLRSTWPSAALVSIRSIDPNDADFADLRPLKKLIGKARVVQLGEQSHGDGATFYAKQRLIRFLHREMGFTVLAWESGFFDCEEMDKALHADTSISDARAKGLFAILSDGPFVAPVFEYARSTYASKRPLRMTGFDIQYSGRDTRPLLAGRIFEYLSRVQPELARPETKQAVEDLIWGRYKPIPEERDKRRAALQTIITALTGSHGNEGGRERAFYLKALDNIVAFDQQRWMTPSMPPPAQADNFRDNAMAENVLWLMREWYPQEKVIVWAANSHILRNAKLIDTRTDQFSYKERLTMGDILHQRLGSSIYSIGFTAYAGEMGNPFMEPRALPPVQESSLEAELHALGREYLLVDIGRLPAKHRLRSQMLAWPLGYMPMESVWANNFDALVFTDVMFSNGKNARLPDRVATSSRK